MLSVLVGSGVFEEATAVSVSTSVAVNDAETLATTVKTSEPVLIAEAVKVTVLPEVVKVKPSGLLGTPSLTRLMPAGRVSVSLTPEAPSGPLLVRVSV